MKRTEYLSVPGGLFAAVLLALAAHGPANAQADSKTLSGKSTTSGKVMTREELRACMKQQSTLASRKAELDSRQSAQALQRKEIEAESGAIKAEQDALGSTQARVDALTQRVTAFSARVKQLNEHREDFERAGRTGPAADRERRLMDKEAADLKKEEADIGTEREQIVSGSQDAAAKINARVEAQQVKAQSWNDASKALTADQQAYEDDRVNWVDTCGNRRFKEDDEKAIKAGK
jgi:chromosome segregation ATPase